MEYRCDGYVRVARVPKGLKGLAFRRFVMFDGCLIA
jgi:hypothetical protein